MSPERKGKKTRRVGRFDFLLRLMNFYRNEADKCGRAGAYFAGCIVLGAAIEASLLAMVKCYPEKVKKTKTYQRKNQPPYDLNLYDLLKIAIELGWIPSKLPLDKTARTSGLTSDYALSKGDVGYFVDVAREIRNLVHPGKHVKLWKGVRISKGYYQFCHELTDVVIDHLVEKVEESLRRSMKK